ncbi:putative phosphoserine aminotransferase [Cyclospora cayetanensis]|uniref:phosphoserine transaminase n=1 Tax=Cyclospora cayetanensis TaxID=88456 RepID=A0A1D3CZ60_9EIME|nr:putative phosphoserine aminotransferase [Cyclospora cayetanensis]
MRTALNAAAVPDVAIIQIVREELLQAREKQPQCLAAAMQGKAASAFVVANAATQLSPLLSGTIGGDVQICWCTQTSSAGAAGPSNPGGSRACVHPVNPTKSDPPRHTSISSRSLAMPGGKRLINFSAGPCQLPIEVLEDVQKEIADYNGWGISVLEMSHRGSHFKKVLTEATETALKFLEVPQTHSLLFMSGGATGQFAAQALNFINAEHPVADYAVTGYWSKYAMVEGSMFGKTRAVTNAADMGFLEIDPIDSWDLSNKPAYIHYCDNETIEGMEFPSPPPLKLHRPECLVIADMASNLGTKPVEWGNIDLAYAGAQKNIGVAGVTVVVLNRAIVGRTATRCPSVLNYKKILDASSCLNTPPAVNIFVTGRTLKHLASVGDLGYWDRLCTKKSDAVYGQCDHSEGFFVAPVKPTFRSRVTVRFAIAANETAVQQEIQDRRKQDASEAPLDGSGAYTPEYTKQDHLAIEEARAKDNQLTKQFLEIAEKHDMICLEFQEQYSVV